MPYSITYLDDGGALSDYWGNISDNDLISAAQDKYSSQDKIKSLCYSIADFTKVEKFDVTSEGIRNSSKLAAEIESINKNIILVAIMPTDLEFGMGRMWEAHAYPSNIKTKVFRDRVEAENWIKEQLKT